MLLKTKNRQNEPEENESQKVQPKKQTTYTAPALAPPNKAVNDYDWDVVDEYDPFWPNEYEKLVKERRERDHDRSRDRDRDRKRRNTRDRNAHNNDNDERSSPPHKYSGFAGRSDDTETFNKSPPQRGFGAAIAPPSSLIESTPIIPAFQNNNNANSGGAGSVAAKIMAKYGFKDGQGLGKQEQGMSVALQVEKTSKRGGRIIHEKELMQPPAIPSPPIQMNPPTTPQSTQPKEEPSITEIMKAPSKVVLLRVCLHFFLLCTHY